MHATTLSYFFFFVFLVEMGFHPVGQDGLELLTSGGPAASVSQSAGITGVNHCAWPITKILKMVSSKRCLLSLFNSLFVDFPPPSDLTLVFTMLARMVSIS